MFFTIIVVDRIIIIYPPKNFVKSDGTKGKIARLLIADKSGTLKVVFWNDKTEIIKDRGIEHGHIVKILHGYTKEGMNNKVELHFGSRSEINIFPIEKNHQDYPPLSSFMKKIKQLVWIGFFIG